MPLIQLTIINKQLPVTLTCALGKSASLLFQAPNFSCAVILHCLLLIDNCSLKKAGSEVLRSRRR